MTKAKNEVFIEFYNLKIVILWGELTFGAGE